MIVLLWNASLEQETSNNRTKTTVRTYPYLLHTSYTHIPLSPPLPSYTHIHTQPSFPSPTVIHTHTNCDLFLLLLGSIHISPCSSDIEQSKCAPFWELSPNLPYTKLSTTKTTDFHPLLDTSTRFYLKVLATSLEHKTHQRLHSSTE